MSRTLRAILVALCLGAGLAGTAQGQTYFGGTVAVYITVQLATSSITTVQCSGTVSNVNDSSGHLNSESGTVAATISGATANCAVIIPYVWLLSSQSTDTFDVSYTVTGTGAGGTRIGTHGLANSVAVPADGVGTGYTITTRL